MKFRPIRHLRQRIKYYRDLTRYWRDATDKATPKPSLLKLRPILGEDTATTAFDRHYVYHTAWAARVLRESSAHHHVDIGSLIHFATLVSPFVPMTHYDFRPPELQLSNLSVGKADLMELPFPDRSLMSLSCMHVVEHIGLGRYGDTIDADGDRRAMSELQRVVADGGQLLFVVPVGRPVIVFNAHRIYSFEMIVGNFPELTLENFSLITDRRNGGTLIIDADPALVSDQKYGCGCFLFRRNAPRGN